MKQAIESNQTRTQHWVKQMEVQIDKIDRVFLEFGHPYDHVDFGELTHEDRHLYFWWDEFLSRYLDIKHKIIYYNKGIIKELDMFIDPKEYAQFVEGSINKFFHHNQDLQILKKFNKIIPYVHRDFL
ncbi:MAG: hypothetical protein OXC03_01090 [Flavobacteriaceae bacterium]|nr:hypothetical protein [Flavobacteriaceae bacterium]